MYIIIYILSYIYIFSMYYDINTYIYIYIFIDICTLYTDVTMQLEDLTSNGLVTSGTDWK
jgi:hypothetical protein